MNVRYFFIFAIFSLIQLKVYPQVVEIIGKVRNEEKQAMTNVHIAVQEIGIRTTTDSNGNFRIMTTSSDSLTMIFSHIGYKTRTETIYPEQKNLTIILETANFHLSGITVSEDRPEDFRMQNAATGSL